MVLTPYMDRLKKEYVQELLLLLSDWKATLRFCLGVSSWKWYGWANRSSVYIPYLFCQLCSGSSVRPGFGEQGWRSGWALASPQSDPGSNPGINTICGLGLLLVLSLALRGFSLGNSGFPLSLKPTFSNFSSTRNGSRTTTLYQLSC